MGEEKHHDDDGDYDVDIIIMTIKENNKYKKNWRQRKEKQTSNQNITKEKGEEGSGREAIRSRSKEIGDVPLCTKQTLKTYVSEMRHLEKCLRDMECMSGFFRAL